MGLVQLRFFLLGLYKSFHRDQPKFPSPPSLAGICQLPNLAGKNLSVLKASRIHASIGQGVTISRTRESSTGRAGHCLAM